MSAPPRESQLSPAGFHLPPPTFSRIEVIRVGAPADRLDALEIRRRVFVKEQNAPDLRVSDSDDARSIIALAYLTADDRDERWPVSTGRLTPPLLASDPGLIAWVATLPEARGQEAGAAVMRYLLDTADRARIRELALAAQYPAERFYLRLGFIRAGPLYDVRGIPHRRMIRRFRG